MRNFCALTFGGRDGGEVLQVIGAGLPRTGTMSVKSALEHLGLGPCHHMVDLYTNPEHIDRWIKADSDPVVDWDWVLAGYRSSQDWPAALFWRELAQAYPQVKVLLTVRDPDQWCASFRRIPSLKLDARHVHERARPLLAARERLNPILRRKGQEIFGEGWHPGQSLDEATAVAAFHRHVTAVRQGIDEERLLVFDVRQGWEPLCEFLGVDPPEEAPFPYLNDSASLQRMFQQFVSHGRVSSSR